MKSKEQLAAVLVQLNEADPLTLEKFEDIAGDLRDGELDHLIAMAQKDAEA